MSAFSSSCLPLFKQKQSRVVICSPILPPHPWLTLTWPPFSLKLVTFIVKSNEQSSNFCWYCWRLFCCFGDWHISTNRSAVSIPQRAAAVAVRPLFSSIHRQVNRLPTTKCPTAVPVVRIGALRAAHAQHRCSHHGFQSKPTSPYHDLGNTSMLIDFAELANSPEILKILANKVIWRNSLRTRTKRARAHTPSLTQK